MYMRLAFSVAINVDADVLLIDEILGVAMSTFRRSVSRSYRRSKAEGTTIVIVSHSMGQIEQICDRCIWIEDGLIKEEGVPKYVDEHYLSEMEQIRLNGKKLTARKNTLPQKKPKKPQRDLRKRLPRRKPQMRKSSPSRNCRHSVKSRQFVWEPVRYSLQMPPCWTRTANPSMCSAPVTRSPCGSNIIA